MSLFSSHEELDDPIPIYKPPSRILKFLEQTKWYWPVLLLIGAFALYSLLVPQSEVKAYTIWQTLSLLLVMLTLLFLPFYIGLQLGIGVYKPKESHLTRKQLRYLDEALGNGETVVINLKKNKSANIEKEKEGKS